MDKGQKTEDIGWMTGQRTKDIGQRRGLWTAGLRTGLFAFVLCPLSFVLSAFAAPQFAVTPYLQHPSSDAMTIIFFTAEACTATVEARPVAGDRTVAASATASGGAVAGAATVRSATTTGEWAQALTNNLVCGDTSRTTGRLYRHRVRFEGLEPNRAYGYTVTLAGGATYSNSFRTAPGRDTPIRFVAYADSETTADPWDNYVKNLAQMKAREPDFIAIPGDLVARGGIQSHWDGFWKANAGARGDIAGSIPLLTVLGNHDLYDNGVKGDAEGQYKYDLQGETGTERYLAYFENEPNGVEYKYRDGTTIPETRDLSQLFHRVDYGPVTLIFLDTNNGDDNDPSKDTNYETRTGNYCPPGIDRHLGGRHPDFNPGSPQYDWLTNQLADAQANSRFTFVLNHHCPYSIGSHNKGPTETGGSAQPVRVLTETMVRYGVDGWICGHDEILEHSITNGWEILPDGSKRRHTLSIYDLGCSGDTFRQSNSCTNPLEYFKVTSSNYGFLEVDVNTNRSGRWTCSLTPVDVSGGSYRAQTDQIILEENAERGESVNDLVYAEYAKTKAISGVSSAKPTDWLEFSREEPAPVDPDDPPVDPPDDPGTDEDETIVLLPGATTNLTTAATATAWNAKVSSTSTSVVTVKVSRNADGTAKITLTGGTISEENLTADDVYLNHRATVEIRSGSSTSGQGTLVKTIAVNLGEAIRLKKGESVDRALSYSSGRRWAVASEQGGSYVDVALDKTSEAYPQDGYGYCLRTTKDATSATLTMTGRAVGTETVVFARQYVTSSKVTKPTAMAIYYVTVYDEEEPPVDPPEPPPVEPDPVVTNTITYVGLEGAANPNPSEFTTNDLPLVLSAPGTREGYTFLGWTPDGGVIPKGTVTNVTFTATWEKVEEPPVGPSERTVELAPGEIFTDTCKDSFYRRWDLDTLPKCVSATVGSRGFSVELTITGEEVGSGTVTVRCNAGEGGAYIPIYVYHVTVKSGEEPPVDPPEPPPVEPPVEETIEVKADQSVTRTLSSGEGCIWLFGGEKAFANARAALNIGYSRKGSGDYPYVSTRKVTGVTVTLTGVAAGEERILVARQGEDGELVPAAIYTVKVTPREKTPYEKLCDAFAAGGEYALGEDVECPREGLLELGEGQSLALDLNGCSILCHADGTIRNAGDLTILDSTASNPFAAHVAFGEDELGKGLALIRNRPGATLTVDGAWIEAGFIDATGDYEFGGGNTAVLAQGGLVSVTGGGHLGGLVGIDVTGPTDVFIDGGADVTADTWRSGGLQLGTCVRFAAGDSSLTVGDALLESEGRIVQTLGGSRLEAAFSGAALRSSRASAPFELADGATVSLADSSYEDLTAATSYSQVTALANAGAALSVGAGCTLTVSGESVIGFLADGVAAEATGAHTWRTVESEGNFFSFALDLDHVVDPATVTGEMVEVTAVKAVGEGLELTVRIEGVPVGRNAQPENLSQVFGAVGSATTGDFSADKVICGSMRNNGDGTVSYTVEPKVAPGEAKPGTFFFRARVIR